ncbi:hypothetical protein AB0I85_27435 [Micromonospora echinofusca]|nr:hypothetical protein [Micromonospora sp. MSM11]MCL7457377.1 hypothetical protein [Micromonospora sp. MSM11]
MDEQFGGEQGSHAGQASDDRRQLVLVEVLGDEIVDGGDALFDGEDLGGHLPDDHGGGALTGQVDGLLAGGCHHRLGDLDGVLDVAAAEQGGDPVDVGVPDRRQRLPARQDHHRGLPVQVHSPLQGGADAGE